MLLLTAVTFGGADAVASFDHLPDDEGELLKHRAQALLQIPRERRIPLLVQEIKRLVTARRRQLASADPPRLAEVMGKERGALVEVVLQALPSQLADAVRLELPDRGVKPMREVKPDILSIVRWKLEEALKRSVPKVGAFRFTDVLTLQSREVLTICDRMGARALATAFAGLPDAERDQLFSTLPPDQRSLAQRASEAGKTRHLNEDDSRTVLGLYGALENPSAGLQSSGAHRLIRAALAHSPDFAARLVERHPNELGKLLARWMKDERHKPARGDGGRADIVEQMERLAQRGVLDRPMRLPPPPLKLPPPMPKGELPGGKLMVPPPKPPKPGERPLAPPPPDRGAGGSAVRPRRDLIAEREARKAGAASARPGQRGTGPREAANDPRVPVATEPSLRAQARIVRDGQSIDREHPAVKIDPKTGKRAVTSPAFQEIPKRRERPPASTGSRAAVVKGPGKGEGGGGGSR